jgi:hypothetical protein
MFIHIHIFSIPEYEEVSGMLYVSCMYVYMSAPP